MNQLQRNQSNQLGELAEILSDYEMLRYYNPYYFKWKLQDLQDAKQDLYYKSVGSTDFDSVFGITMTSMRVDSIAIRLIALDEQIDRAEREYRKHRAIFKEHTDGLQRSDRNDLKRYFKAQMTGNDITIDSIEELKRKLYQVELKQRNKRNKAAEDLRRIETERRAKEIVMQRKKDRALRRYGMNAQFTH